MNKTEKPAAGSSGNSPHPKSNLLGSLSNQVLIPGLLFIFGLIGTACYQWGKRDAEQGARELKQTLGLQQQKIQSLIDTILTIKLTKKDTITSMQEPRQQ